jgi:hypothetical protein
VRTLRQAAELLAAANSVNSLAIIAGVLGFSNAPLPLDADARLRLHLPTVLTDAHVARGRGALRALLVTAPPDAPLRPLLTTIAAGLAARTAHVLWLVIATNDAGEIAIASWSAARRPPRVVALLAHRNRIVASDAEALCALAAASDGDDLLVHTRWHDLLGREALSRRFYRTLEQRVRALGHSLHGVPDDDRAELALLTTSRLLFLSFLQAKGWLNGERAFLAERYDECMAGSGNFHRRVLLPLFFGTLNTPIRQRAPSARRFGAIPFLNGGLFARTAAERRHARVYFSDESLGALFSELLGAYRFTAREDQAEWSEVAVDPEMLGRAFESLMASRERRVSGAYYTPQPMVAHIADEALVISLGQQPLAPEVVRHALGGATLPPEAATLLRHRLRALTVLDPACGSGAFLVYLLERLTALHRAAGDQRPVPCIRREVLARSIHGVDSNPTAAWLCELRLWLSVVIESDETRMSAVTPLPNLDCNIRVGDTLAGDAFVAPPALLGPSAVLVRLRDRYVRAAGARKAPLRRALAREERQRALAGIDRELVTLAAARRERVLLRRARDLFGERSGAGAAEREESRRLRGRSAALRRERRRLADGGALPFSFPSHFAHAHVSGGFSLVIGNPPWVRLHNIPLAMRVLLRERFSVYRGAAWQPVFEGVESRQQFGAQVDLASLFVERSVDLAAAGGTVALLLPAKLWRSLAGGPVRRLLARDTELRCAEDWTDAPCAFDAAVYPSLIIASRMPAAAEPLQLGVRRRTLALQWSADPRTLPLSADDPASPWLILPADVRVAFDRLAARGRPLGHGTLGRATLGVKCGCNDAFALEMLDAGDADSPLVEVRHRGRHGAVERQLVRPLLRGEALTPWRVQPARDAILWTHAAHGPLRTLPFGAARWLAPWRRQLLARTDLRGARSWWMLFRTDGADSARARVVWSDFGRAPRAAYLAPGDQTVPLNSCYVLATDDACDALALTALLNSPVVAAWLNAIAEPARGGWHRYLAWTVSLLPLPGDWPRARCILAPLAERALLGELPTEDELLRATCHAYHIRREDVAPLIAWCR